MPRGTRLRPVLTGWFAEFGALDAAPAAAPASYSGSGSYSGVVAYGEGAARFAGATYDPTSHYRAAAVFDFFEAKGLGPGLLREVSRHQVARLAAAFDALDADPAVIDRDRSAPLAAFGGFLALRSPRAGELVAALARRGVAADHRGYTLRLGPAPYLSDAQLDAAVAVLGEVVG